MNEPIRITRYQRKVVESKKMGFSPWLVKCNQPSQNVSPLSPSISEVGNLIFFFSFLSPGGRGLR
jgi:hypothetical protein